MSQSGRLRKAREDFLAGIGVPESEEFLVDGFQKAAIESVTAGHDTLVVAPTGSGKTFIAMEAIRAFVGMSARTVYTTPLKALSNTKYNDLSKVFQGEAKVGLLTGDRKIDPDAHVVIATTEIYRNELYRESTTYGLVVLDEVHFIADEQRGAVWEETIILSPKESTLLMLSASISNPHEIASWLESVRGKPCTVIIEKNRPVELRLGFIHPEFGVIPLTDDRGKLLSEIQEFYGTHGTESHGRRGQARRRRHR